MALKVSENSLFAVLLRSPWWYSVLIALFVVAVSVMLVGGKFLVFGLATSLPFIGIAIYSAYKQSQRPGKKRLLEVEQDARKMSVANMAKKIASNYENINFDVVPFKGDAAELELERGRHKFLLSCKRFKAANTGIEPLKQLVSAGEKNEATGYLYVALGEVTANARDYALKNNIEFIQAEALAEYFDGTEKLL